MQTAIIATVIAIGLLYIQRTIEREAQRIEATLEALPANLLAELRRSNTNANGLQL